MAIVIFGKTTCVICRGIINDQNNVVCFEPFATHSENPIRIFSDAAAHRSCFLNYPGFEEVLQHCQSSLESLPPSPFTCKLCGNPIADPNDLIAIGKISCDSKGAAFHLNHSACHISCIRKWNSFDIFVSELNMQSKCDEESNTKERKRVLRCIFKNHGSVP